MRELKALELAARSRIAFTEGGWLVPSQFAPGTLYRVTIGSLPSCEGEDCSFASRTASTFSPRSSLPPATVSAKLLPLL
jgi:hypothetical protein